MMVNFNTYGMKNKEFFYRASRISEALALQGVPVIYTPSISYTTNIDNDPTPVYTDPVSTFIRFVDLPRTTLEKRHWISEGETPIIAEISAILFSEYKEWRNNGSDLDNTDSFTIPISRWSLIEMPYKMVADGSNMYRITDIQGLTNRPFVWECRLAPQRKQLDFNPETPEIEESNDGNRFFDNTMLGSGKGESFEDFSKGNR